MPMYHGLRVRKTDTAEVKLGKQRVAERLLDLRKSLRAHIGEDPDGLHPGRDPRQWMRLATWNIREFPSGKYGHRLPNESYYYIAEIISHFDVIALQEIRDDLRALKKVMRLLGPNWMYIATDVCEGKSGNGERMVFVYNTNTAYFRNVAGELILADSNRIAYPHNERLKWSGMEIELPDGAKLSSPAEVTTRKSKDKVKLTKDVPIELPEGTKLVLKKGSKIVLPRNYEVQLTDDGSIELPESTEITFDQSVMVDLPTNSIVGDKLQFARQPFLISLQSGWLKLMLCTVHIYYGSDSESSAGMRRRKQEIRQLTKLLAKRAQSETDSDASNFFIVLGDFNIVGKGHGTMEALKSNGFTIPSALNHVPGSNVDKSKAYDQIAYWSPPDGTKPSDTAHGVIKIEAGRAGVFDFFRHVFRRGAQDPKGADEAYYTPIMNAMHDDVGSTGKWTYKEWRTFQMSDHLPMWVELRVDFGDDYLEAIEDT